MKKTYFIRRVITCSKIGLEDFIERKSLIKILERAWAWLFFRF
jgi:hypothetical protein